MPKSLLPPCFADDSDYFLFGVYHGSRWALTSNLDAALVAASRYPGSEIRTMTVYEGDGYSSFDAPTFRILSDPLALASTIAA